MKGWIDITTMFPSNFEAFDSELSHWYYKQCYIYATEEWNKSISILLGDTSVLKDLTLFSTNRHKSQCGNVLSVFQSKYKSKYT